MKKSNFPKVTTLLFIITAIVTVSLFYYLSEEKERTSLYTFNMVYVLFLELIFFGYITLISYSKIHSNVIFVVGGTLVIIYIIIAASVVIIYNLYLSQFLSNKVYISSIAVGTTLTIIIYGFLIKFDTHQTTNTEIDKSNRLSIKSIVLNFELLKSKYESLVITKNLLEHDQSDHLNLINKLITKIKFLPPSSTKNDRFLSIIQDCEQKLNMIITQIDTTEDLKTKESINQINKTVSDAILAIESLKESFLK